MAQIHELMPRVMADVGAIPKTHRNKAQSYDFRSIEDALNLVQPVLVKYGISLSFEASDYKTDSVQEAKAAGQGTRTVYRSTLSMRVTLFAPDGSSVAHVSAGEGMDYGGDKATNKALAAAFKYALFLGLCIPVKGPEIDDSDRDGGDASKDVEAGNGKATAATTTQLQTGTQSGAQAHEERLGTALASRVQFARIKELFDAMAIPAEKRLASLKKRGASKPSELTSGAAIDLIAALEWGLEKKQAEEVFPGGRQASGRS